MDRVVGGLWRQLRHGPSVGMDHEVSLTMPIRRQINESQVDPSQVDPSQIDPQQVDPSGGQTDPFGDQQQAAPQQQADPFGGIAG